MRRIALSAWLGFLLLPPLLAQSVVFVSPSTQGQLTIACSADSLTSFEELHYLATARYLAKQLCTQGHVDAAVGLWRGRAENSGMIDGCTHDRARALGALLGEYYHQKAALVFERKPGGQARLVSFRVQASLPVISRKLTRSQVSGATVVPRGASALIFMVATDDRARGRAHRLYVQLHGLDLQEEAGTAELIGDNDRARAKDIYHQLLLKAPAEVQALESGMYSEHFSDLGMDGASQ